MLLLSCAAGRSILIWFVALSAQATEIDAHGFVPAAFEPDARDLLSVRRAGRINGRSAYLGGIAEYAKAPLVARATTGRQWALIDHLATLNVVGGFAPVDRLRFDLAVPVYGFVGEALDSSSRGGLGLGDSRISAMVSLIAPPKDADVGFGLALVPHLDLPTGRFDAYLGRRRFAGGGVASATLEAGRFTASAEGGLQLETRSEERNFTNPDAVRFGAGIGVLFEPRVGLSAEVVGQVGLDGQVGTTETPVEVLSHLRFAGDNGGLFAIGGAVGVSQGVGASAFRVFLGGGFGATARPRDRDQDGIYDADDACLREPENLNGFEDDDGCPDTMPQVRVRVRLDGQVVEGAEVALQGPNQHAFQTTFAEQGFDSLPGARWNATARLGACLVGQDSAEVGPTGADLTIDLVRSTVGKVKIVLFDPNGNLIPNAVVTLRSKQLGCVPSTTFRTTANEALYIDVGQGVHQLTVRTRSSVEERDFTVVPGKNAEFVLVMKP